MKSILLHLLAVTTCAFANVKMNAQELKDVSDRFGVAPKTVFVDTTGYSDFERMPAVVIASRMYITRTVVYAWISDNPCTSGSDCVKPDSFAVNTARLRDLADSMVAYYPESRWCFLELRHDRVDINVSFPAPVHQGLFRFRTGLNLYSMTLWFYSDPVGIDEEKTDPDVQLSNRTVFGLQAFNKLIRGYLKSSSATGYTVTMTDVTGNVVHVGTLEAPLKDLHRGWYGVMIRDPYGVPVKLFVVGLVE